MAIDMNIYEELGSVFSEVLVQIVSTVSSIAIAPSSCESSYDCEELTGVMALNSKEGGVLMISGNKTGMCRFCSMMLGVPENEVSEEDMVDALCEVVNMTAGSAKLRLVGTDFMFTYSSPFVIKGGMSVTVKEKTRVITKLLTGNELTLKLIMVY